MVIIISLVAFMAIYGTYQYACSKNIIDKEGFIGTYQRENSVDYITLLVESDESGYSFYSYDDDGNEQDRGTYEYIDNNVVVVKGIEGHILYTIIYNKGNFKIVDNEIEQSYVITKVSNEPIVRE